MIELTYFEIFKIWATCFFTLAAFSFLYRDNPLYKLVEHIYIGVSAGYGLYQGMRSTIYPNLIMYLQQGMNGTLPPDAQSVLSYHWRWGAAVLGILLLSRLIPKLGWVSRWPMAMIIGAYAGLNIVGLTKANLVDQLHASFIPLYTPGMPFWPVFEAGKATAPTVVNHLVLVFGLLAAMIYFFFSMGNRGPIKKIGLLGIGIIMITFGATYGSIVLARVSLLIGRAQELYEANQTFPGYPAMTCAAIVIAILLVWRFVYFKPEEDNA